MKAELIAQDYSNRILRSRIKIEIWCIWEARLQLHLRVFKKGTFIESEEWAWRARNGETATKWMNRINGSTYDLVKWIENTISMNKYHVRLIQSPSLAIPIEYC